MIDNIIETISICFAILFVIVLIIKRFCYFKPSQDFIEPQLPFIDIMEGNIHAWYIKGINNKVILFCHGNAGNLTHRQQKIAELNKMGFSVLIFDYTGYGKSIGVPTEQMCYHNAAVYMNYLSRIYNRDNIILYGESLGAAVAMYIARKYNLKTVILESAIPSIKSLIKYNYPYISLFSFIFSNFQTEEYIKGYKGNVLCLHCINDEIIPISLTQILKENCSKFIEMDGNHNNPSIPWKEVELFLKK